jgi:phosphoserine phosphatase
VGRPLKMKAVCFDMDGTLIRNTDSVRYLCALNRKTGDFDEVRRLEDLKKISWIDADYRKAALIRGLEVEKVEDEFEEGIELIQNVGRVLAYLRGRRIKTVLVTAGPIQVADILKMKYGFDEVHGSIYDVRDKKFTGSITTHLGNTGKLHILEDFCKRHSIGLNQCVAIGDSESDIEVFNNCGRSIAINYSEALEGMASEYVTTDDLFDIIDILEPWL